MQEPQDEDEEDEVSRVSEEDNAVDEEPEYDPSPSSEPEFPITHEATLKEHTKVISALTLDPSGARVLSGSHDYDCKLWDFGGMTTQTRSFKTWEPAGSYYVGVLSIERWRYLNRNLGMPGQRPQIFQRRSAVPCDLSHDPGQAVRP